MSKERKTKYAFGVASRTFDNSHVFMCDIDADISLKSVVKIGEEIQKTFLLSTLYVIESSNGWNLLTLDKLPLKLVYMINKEIPEACRKYNRISFYERGFYVLRMGNDKKVVKDIGGYNLFLKSNAHRLFFQNCLRGFPFWSQLETSFDDNTRFWITKFKCNKHGWELIS